MGFFARSDDENVEKIGSYGGSAKKTDIPSGNLT
jgi:hypothetical protein